ncbi:hypothetical protein [Micromonospora purpureochromogenes]|uniref:Uncharacterized protein n=1 Tax=Micromonospora purpureochromogenes TaxID=47872 RepID=A0ABX2RVA5_9ACTN|nr:hypothetical protein [Micromonospora purpureochromogenes]NYF60038.1 hypothetical protein [Micromonospora purpureochromogenes]
MVRRAAVTNPDRLAPKLTLLLDDGLFAGVLDADPATADAAKDAVRALFETACPVGLTSSDH